MRRPRAAGIAALLLDVAGLEVLLREMLWIWLPAVVLVELDLSWQKQWGAAA